MWERDGQGRNGKGTAREKGRASEIGGKCEWGVERMVKKKDESNNKKTELATTNMSQTETETDTEK